jgi:hypothetical protein
MQDPPIAYEVGIAVSLVHRVRELILSRATNRRQSLYPLRPLFLPGALFRENGGHGL